MFVSAKAVGRLLCYPGKKEHKETFRKAESQKQKQLNKHKFQ
jgi:hypothetical protein